MKKFLFLALILVFLIVILAFLKFPASQINLTSPLNFATKPANLKPPVPSKDFSKLIQSYNQILSETQTEFAVTFLDLKSSEKVSIAGEKSFHAASTTKTMVAVYALKQVDKGKMSLDQKIGDTPLFERLRLMTNISDNDSWEQLLKFFGITSIQKFTQSLDLANTNHFQNTSTTNDLAKFLALIYQQPVLSSENKEFLLNSMQNTEREDLIPAGIVAKKLVFHKAGSYQGEIHDTAIVVHPDSPFVLAILSNGQNDLDIRPKILAKLAKVSWEFASQQ